VIKKVGSVEIVLDPSNSGWILEKVANRLCLEFSNLGIESKVLPKPDFAASVVLWVQYADKTINLTKVENFTGISSALVTHVDDSFKLSRVRKLYLGGVDLIFMSKEHACTIAELINMQVPPFNILLGSDLAIERDVFKVGIVSKCYPDGRKNEGWLLDFAVRGLLEHVELTIIGTGWEKIVKKLRSLGVSIVLFNDQENPYPEYSEIQDATRGFDLFLNFGFDEGSLGALDAFLLGTDMLISRHGFHIEFGLSDDNYVLNLLDAREKFESKKRIFFDKQQKIRGWTWATTAHDLYYHWDSMKVASDNKFPDPSLNGKIRRIYLFAYLRMFVKTLRRVIVIRAPRKILTLVKLVINRLRGF
jgi:hypothetical protein